MKKRTSVSALGLRLTLWPVIGIVLLCAGLQYAVYLRTMVQWDSSSYISFEWLLDHEGIYTLGKCSFLLILLVTLIAPRNQARYTLARLRISEGEIALHWSLVFAGWYLLSWAAQLLTVLLLFRQFAPLAELEPLDFFLACYRSRYLRCLLPLGSGWALARTILLCLGWGATGALTGLYTRHGGKPYMALILVIVTIVLLPLDMASLARDVWMCIEMLTLVILQIFQIRKEMRNED